MWWELLKAPILCRIRIRLSRATTYMLDESDESKMRVVNWTHAGLYNLKYVYIAMFLA